MEDSDSEPQPKKYYKGPKVFQEAWLQDPTFKNWLIADKKKFAQIFFPKLKVNVCNRTLILY